MIQESSLVSAGSMVLFAGAADFGLLDQLPKGALVALTLLMFGIISFFVKRDWKKTQDDVAALKGRVSGTEDSFKRAVTVESFTLSQTRMHEKVNALSDRVVVLETVLGVRGPANMRLSEDTDE